MKNLSAENTILLAIAKLQTNEDVLHLIENQLLLITDWEGFYYRAVKLGLGAMIPSVFQKINKPDLIPAEILSRFQAIYHRSLARNILL